MLGELSWPLSDASQEDSSSLMDQASFVDFYYQTAPALRGYLRRASGNLTLADDLMQEAYVRFLGSANAFKSDFHRRNYLFRIASNLLCDHFRRPDHQPRETPELGTDSPEESIHRRSDVGRVLSSLPPRQRMMLWLAYVEGESHREIARAMGIKTASIKSMLSRARARMARLLREKGLGLPEEGR